MFGGGAYVDIPNVFPDFEADENDPASYKGQIREILANASIFGTDLTKTSLADKVEAYFVKLLGGVGAARALLQTELPA